MKSSSIRDISPVIIKIIHGNVSPIVTNMVARFFKILHLMDEILDETEFTYLEVVPYLEL